MRGCDVEQDPNCRVSEVSSYAGSAYFDASSVKSPHQDVPGRRGAINRLRASISSSDRTAKTVAPRSGETW